MGEIVEDGGFAVGIRRPVERIVCALMLLIAFAPPGFASRLIERSVEEMTARSSLVAMGRVVDIRSYWNGAGTQIQTDITIRIDSIERGSYPGSTVVITQLGGVVGDEAMTVVGLPTFTLDESVLVFLKPRPGTTQDMTVTGLGQGKFRVTQTRTETMVENEYKGRMPLATIRQRIQNTPTR
jgi:hypothetical protein